MGHKVVAQNFWSVVFTKQTIQKKKQLNKKEFHLKSKLTIIDISKKDPRQRCQKLVM